MKIYLGADHRGFELKEKLKSFLLEQNYEVEDLGAYEYDKDDDYPAFAEKVGRAVRSGTEGRGILLCGSGTGMDSAVNKVKGVRASIGHIPDEVRDGRHDDNMNVLVIAADFTGEEEAQELAEVFLKTSFDASTERYNRRINQIKEIEEGEC